jgi:non-lysosomal glucosylceramidase
LTGKLWPVLRSYRGVERRSVSLPLGGIGTGSVGFGGRAQFRDWELENHPAKGSVAGGTFLAVRWAAQGLAPEAFVLEGEMFPEEVEGPLGARAPLAGLRRFRHCVFETAYPYGRALLEDPEAPLQALVEAWSAFVPGDEEASGLPVAVLTVSIKSLHPHPLDVTVMFSVEDLVGHRLRVPGLTAGGSRPTLEPRRAEGLSGVLLGDAGLSTDDEEWGTLAASVLGDDALPLSQWSYGKWNQGLTKMWVGLVSEGAPAEGDFEPEVGQAPCACVGAQRRLSPLGQASVTFLIGWHFPNRRGWKFVGPGPKGGPTKDIVGNYYCTQASDAWDSLERFASRLSDLEERTRSFLEAFCTSDLSPVIKEAALFNLSTFSTQTFFRTADGNPYGWEGCLDDAGSCYGSCTHVWNYELATPYVFPSLARKMREIEFLHATSSEGAMSFRVGLPLSKAQEWPWAAADGQFGCIVKAMREWRNSGDDAFLAGIWPSCKRALEFAWLPGSWDADQDGVAEGCLHNTMDVEYFGPTGIIQGWYLAALAAAAEMADAMGDSLFAVRCRELRHQGAAWTDANLFNGAYYAQQVRPPGSSADLRPEVRHPRMGAQNLLDPEFQVAEGCLIDQLAGEVAASFAGVSTGLAPDHVATALESIHRLNYVRRLGSWTNFMRTFGSNEDEGHVMLAYPDRRPAHPMPYWSEVMTGFEYTYALALALKGRPGFAEEVVRMVRRRYDGRFRNPYDEAECGHHYARAMASWGLVHAMAGLDYDGRDGSLCLHPDGPEGRWFWAVDGAWGWLERSAEPSMGTMTVAVKVCSGNLRLNRVLVGKEELHLSHCGSLPAGSTAEAVSAGP